MARQSFAELKPYPDNMWESGGEWQKVTIDVDRQPFWVAMRDLASKSGVELRRVERRHAADARRRGDEHGGRPVYSGEFLIVANTLTRNQTVQLTNDGAGKTDDNFGLQLTAFAEPKLRVLRAGNMVKLEEATDDKGNSLVPGPNAAPRYYGYYSGAGAWHLFANLQYPKDPGTRITKLRASTTFTVQTRSQKVEVNNLPSVKEHVQMAGGTRVTIHEFKKVGDSQYQLRIAIGQDAAGGNANGLWEQMQNSIHTRLRVLDAAGRTWDSPRLEHDDQQQRAVDGDHLHARQRPRRPPDRRPRQARVGNPHRNPRPDPPVRVHRPADAEVSAKTREAQPAVRKREIRSTKTRNNSEIAKKKCRKGCVAGPGAAVIGHISLFPVV